MLHNFQIYVYCSGGINNQQYKGYDYLSVTHSTLKNYEIEAESSTGTLTNNKKQKIELSPEKSDRNIYYYLR